MGQDNSGKEKEIWLKKKNVITSSFPTVSTTISKKKKKGIGFSSGYTFITVSRNYTSEWNDY